MDTLKSKYLNIFAQNNTLQLSSDRCILLSIDQRNIHYIYDVKSETKTGNCLKPINQFYQPMPIFYYVLIP